MRCALLLVLAACAREAPEPVGPIGIKVPPGTPKRLCVKQPDEAAAISHASGDKHIVQYCVGTAIDQCFSLELISGGLRRLSEQPAAQSPAIQAAAHVETTNPELKVCGTNGCKTLTPQVWPGAAPLHAATNGTVAAVMLGDAEAGKGYIEVYDVMKAKKLASFKYARGDFKCGEIGMLGDTIYVGTSMCANPSGRAALYTAKGKKIANVGGKPDFGMFGNAYTQVEDTVWAFLEENGNRIALQDVVKGKVKKTIDVSALFESKMGNPGESAIVRLDGGRLAVIAGTPANGSVAVVDVTSGEVTIVRAPLCT
ncbi:MAG TPA: hypothetical protein VFV99_13795 [Kofleriaceae bacterium]|nr:hypothetical protein [Kofleriaceae bacterium]